MTIRQRLKDVFPIIIETPNSFWTGMEPAKAARRSEVAWL